MLNKLIKKWSL